MSRRIDFRKPGTSRRQPRPDESAQQRGRAMETSASFEARYAPSLYPTGGPKRHLQKTRGHILPAKSLSLSSPFSDVPTCSRSIFHSPYTLPSSVSRRSFICHLRKHRGVYQQFPIWNSPGSRVLRASRFSSLFCSSSPRNLCARRLPRPGRGVSALSFSSPLRTFNLQLSAFNLRLPGPASSPDTE